MAERHHPAGGRTVPSRLLLISAASLVVFMSISLRLYALRSDPYPRLDWSAGLLTDEGFYIHNARNVALFGRAVTDEFNNMLLSPVLHRVQVLVFRSLGVGSAQARLISVVFSLWTMALLWGALRRLYGKRVAWTAVAFLGLDHTNLLFSRMALMDPFASFGATLAFWLFVTGRETARDGDANGRVRALDRCRPGLVWLRLASGFALGGTILNRSICVYLLPAPFVAAAAVRSSRACHAGMALGLALAMGIWTMTWWAPNRDEISRVSRYYRLEQVQPRSFRHLANNLYRGPFGDHRGVSPYLFRHTPALFALTLLLLVSGLLPATATPSHRPSSASGVAVREGTAYLTTWLLGGWLVLSASAYSPSRYYVSTYPAMAALAALALHRLPDIVARMGAMTLAARLARGALAAFLVFHAVQSVVHRGGVVGPAATSASLTCLPLAAGFMVAWRPLPVPGLSRVLGVAVPLVWIAANGYWLTDWLRTMRFTQYGISTELGRRLPEGSILLGDVAPGVSMDNRFMAINVIPGLCNGDQPVERFAGAPRYIVILDGRWKERYWREHYPELVAEDRRLMLRRALRWDIGVYAVEGPTLNAHSLSRTVN